MTFHAPQIILVAMYLLGLGATLADHGKPKTGNNNFYISLIAYSITFFLLWWGGFFK